jgi:hypothetical protein
MSTKVALQSPNPTSNRWLKTLAALTECLPEDIGGYVVLTIRTDGQLIIDTNSGEGFESAITVMQEAIRTLSSEDATGAEDTS